jgi:hypothetical protein
LVRGRGRPASTTRGRKALKPGSPTTSAVVNRKFPFQNRLTPIVPSGWASTARRRPGLFRVCGTQRTMARVCP